jgi:hypothetical protein
MNELVQEKPEVNWGKRGCLFGDEGSCEHFSLVTGSRSLEQAKKRATAVVVSLDLAAASQMTTRLRRSLTGGARAVAASRSLPNRTHIAR